jgi:hypothetical protein
MTVYPTDFARLGTLLERAAAHRIKRRRRARLALAVAAVFAVAAGSAIAASQRIQELIRARFLGPSRSARVATDMPSTCAGRTSPTASCTPPA